MSAVDNANQEKSHSVPFEHLFNYTSSILRQFFSLQMFCDIQSLTTRMDPEICLISTTVLNKAQMYGRNC